LVAVRDEHRPAGAALVDRGPTLDHLPPDPGRCANEVERPLIPRLVPTAPLRLRPPADVHAPAGGTRPGNDLDPPAGPQLPVPVRVRFGARLSDQLAAAGVDSLSLIVEPSTPVDELVVGVHECDLPPPLGRPQLIDLLDRCDERVARRVRLK